MKPQSVDGSHLPIVIPIILLMSLSAIGVGLPSIYAENFGIILDNTCKTMIKNNVSSNCPTYEDIITLFPDTSNQDVSGKFAYYNGIYQRTPTKLFDSFEYYRFWNSTILFVDPPVETAKRIKLIEIKANLKEYKLPGSKSYDAGNHTLTVGVGRYIEKCFNAYVDASNWIFLVGDSINHMNNNCSPESTKYASTITTPLNRTIHDISTSYKFKLESWQKEMVLKCGKKVCLYEKEQPTPP